MVVTYLSQPFTVYNVDASGGEPMIDDTRTEVVEQMFAGALVGAYGITDGIQLDAGDLSDTRTSPGTPGPAHRKVRVYETANQFGGQGDDRGCDDPTSGGFTHGQVVASVALGNATAPGTCPPRGSPFDGQPLYSCSGRTSTIVTSSAHVPPSRNAASASRTAATMSCAVPALAASSVAISRSRPNRSPVGAWESVTPSV